MPALDSGLAVSHIDVRSVRCPTSVLSACERRKGCESAASSTYTHEADRPKSRRFDNWRYYVKKVLSLFGLLAVVGGLLMFWRRGDDDAFLDEELD